MTIHSITERILCPICRALNRSDARFCQQCGNDVLLDNIYRITRVIKEGGMGVVYQAIDADGESYAIKEMHDRFTDTKDRLEGIERFIEEAQLLRKLKGHPNIPQVYRSFIDEGRYYLSMEFIIGEDLEDILERQKRFPEPQVLRWAEQLCDVLEYMHQNGLIYRDMKPSNIMITQDGTIKVVDFGIAKLLQPGQRGTMIGTPGYAPPEQYQGIAAQQSDVYALAATLHHLLTGRDPREEPPFSFPPARSIQPDISQATSDALDKALEMELGDRFATLTQFRRALPIPTGDRQPTRRFDPKPTPAARPPVRPAAPPAPTPRPLTQPRPQPRPATSPIPPVQTRQRSRVGRLIRRTIATTLIAGGLAYGGITYGPQALALVQQYFSGQTQLAPSGNAPAGTFVLQPFQVDVEVTVPEKTAANDVLTALRNEYLKQAQAQYPGAELNQNFLPASIGAPAEEALGNGQKIVRATMNGSVRVPQ